MGDRYHIFSLDSLNFDFEFATEDSYAFVLGQAEDETTMATTNDDERWIFCNYRAYCIVFSYVMSFASNVENLALSEAISVLHYLAKTYKKREQCLGEHPQYADEIKKIKIEFTDMLVNSFIPQVLRFFEVPKMEQLLDKQLKTNEILAGFINFLLQMLFSEVTINSVKDQYALLRKEFSFILAVLGDIPFQPSVHPEFNDQVNNLLAEFEMFANEAGAFLFSFVFPVQPMNVNRFDLETNVLLEMAKLLNTKVKEHCSNFSELPVSAILRPSVVDSFFIVDSLIEDIQSIIMNGQLGITPDETMKEQMKTLHVELALSWSLFKEVMQDNDSAEKKEGLGQIRDLTYEAEYLINSFVVGNIPVWYLNVRLPSISCKIEIARIGLEQISKAKAISASDGKVSLPTRRNTAAMVDNQLLDLNQDITERILIDLTRKSNTSRLVISIFGMPGLGKTTIAIKLYNLCSSYFDRHAWCVVSQNYSVKNLLIKILMCVTSNLDENNLSEKGVAELKEDTYKALKGTRYLIVLDDVWHSEVLEILQRYFPEDGNGSRLLITTRKKEVSPDGSIPYELPILSEDECWDLLEKKMFPEDPCPSHLVSIGKRIAAGCSGVPLAVVSIAGVLVNVEKEESEWKKVEEGLNNILLDDESDYSYRNIMELSYQDLPHSLKPCFLYFARFPKDAEISTKELKLFWITQGFVQKGGEKSLEETAETYLSDLINRSLVMTAKRRSDGGMKTCRIHDLLPDICIRKADEENFLKSANFFTTYVKHQHSCLPSSSNSYWRPFSPHCRSFRGTLTDSGFQTMALIKAVDMLLRTDVILPFRLRYLSCDTGFGKWEWGNLVDLEVLHVSSSVIDEVKIPSVILRMAKLRHLYVRDRAKFEEDCNSVSETTNLRSISRVVIQSERDVEILRKSPHLQTLKCIIEGKKVFPDLNSFAELESLRMNFKNSIRDVEIKFPCTIKKLCLRGCKLAWGELSVIGELPKLQVLKLEKEAFVGEEWETKDDQFQELRYLKIESWSLNEWRSESSHFPSLEQLVLSSCWYLAEIPSDLGYIPTLRRIEVRDHCLKETCLSAIEIEKEQHEFGNEHLQVDIIDYRWKKEELIAGVAKEKVWTGSMSWLN